MNQDELQNTVLCGDALEMLKRLPDEYVQMCVTSPPYYGFVTTVPRDRSAVNKRRLNI